MKGFICTALVLTGLVGAAAVTTAHAQVSEPMRFTTSFSFVVGHTQFKPGTYTVSPLDDNNLGVLRVTDGRQTAFITVIPEGAKANEPSDNELTFSRLGDRYYLSEIWDSLDQSAVEPAQWVKDEQKEPHREVAETMHVPFIKIS
jgi:hypothetical protein